MKKIKKVIKKNKKTEKDTKITKGKPKKELNLEKEKAPIKSYSKEKTLKVLSNIKPGLAVKDVVEGMKNFYFDGKNVVTYNDKVSILHPFKTDFQSFIHADTLYKLISKLPDTSFQMKAVKGQILIKSKGVNVKLPAILDEEIISRIKTVNKGIKKIEWKNLPENFLDAINLCSFAASQTEVDTTLSCVKLEEKTCVASDSKRIATSKLTDKIQTMFIKASEVKHLVGIKPTHYGDSKGWLYFKNEENCIFAMRKIEGNFPDWEHLFDFKGPKVDLPKELLNGVDLASIFSNHSAPFLSIIIEKNVCTLLIKSDSGKLKYFAPIEYNGETIDFVINPDFLKEMMRFSTSITFTEGRAKLETDNFAVLTALYSKEDDDEGERYTRHKKKD